MIRWQVTTRHPSTAAVDDQPPGWEPFAVSEGKIWLRRRIDDAADRVAPTGRVLSAAEMAARQRTLVAMQQARAREGLAP